LAEETEQFVKTSECDIPYPATKLMWIPDKVINFLLLQFIKN